MEVGINLSSAALAGRPRIFLLCPVFCSIAFRAVRTSLGEILRAFSKGKSSEFFIQSPFSPIGAAGTNDPVHPTFEPLGKDDNKNTSIGFADDPFACLLRGALRIRGNQRIRVVKDRNRQQKSDVMFPGVAFGLCRIPFKFHVFSIY